MKPNRIIAVLLFVTLIPLSIFAQDKPIVPKGNALAYENQTRQQDGRPGANYWQNSSDYFITASVDVSKKTLSGQEKIVYYNNSPDTLHMVVIRLYQDLFKKGANRNSIVPVNALDITDGVQITSLKLGSSDIDISRDNDQVKRDGTLMYVILSNPLVPKGKLELQIAWTFHIPEYTLIRMGCIDSTSLFIGQWYPQMAVYDDVYGWDTRSYNGMAEFYNDFSNFEVEISVPDKFMVWATGEPTNLNEVLQAPYYNAYKKAAQSAEVTHLVTASDLEKGNITTQQHTWKFKASNVSDFAFGISDHYLWDLSSVEVDKVTHRRTIVGVAYAEDAVNFDKVIAIAIQTVDYMSTQMPGVPYPFPYLTVYSGDFGMEYPMITNVGAEEDYGMTVYANTHEIVHGIFPFYVGTNETKNGWIDEGLTVFMPERLQSLLEPSLNIAAYNTSAFSAYAGLEDEPALITPTHYLDPGVYFYLNYAKTEQALRMLEMELGKDLFKECLQAFIERWKYKHPTPLDYFNTFNDVSGRNLNWFWQAWYYQDGGIPDLAISKVIKTKNGFVVTIENKGDLPIPMVLTFYNGEKTAGNITYLSSIWLNKEEVEVTFPTSENITSIVLGSDIIPDANPKDNEFVVE